MDRKKKKKKEKGNVIIVGFCINFRFNFRCLISFFVVVMYFKIFEFFFFF